MKNKNLKTIILTLVTLLIISGFSSVLVNTAHAGNGTQHNPQQGPSISASPNPVLELETFVVTVKNSNGGPAVGVSVTFNGNTKSTNDQGQCSFLAPSVNSDSGYVIQAIGIDITLSMVITVRAKILYMNVITVNEGDNFKEYVYDQDGNPVGGALVDFMGDFKLTGSDGYTSAFTAPWVYSDISVFVNAWKTVYTSASSGVTIINTQTPLPVTFSGQVCKAQGMTPLQGAIVKSDTGEQSAPTGSDGYYTLTVELSHYGQTVKITGSCSGYKPQSFSFPGLYGGESIIQDFYLIHK